MLAERPQCRRSAKVYWVLRSAVLPLVLAVLALAASPSVSADEAAFDQTIRTLAGACARDASSTCAERFFDLADANADGVADQG